MPPLTGTTINQLVVPKFLRVETGMFSMLPCRPTTCRHRVSMKMIHPGSKPVIGLYVGFHVGSYVGFYAGPDLGLDSDLDPYVWQHVTEYCINH